jgi:hypothetical protein
MIEANALKAPTFGWLPHNNLSPYCGRVTTVWLKARVKL